MLPIQAATVAMGEAENPRLLADHDRHGTTTVTTVAHSPIPVHQGQFVEPRDPALQTELLIIERQIDGGPGWHVTGALVREPAADAAWLPGLVDPAFSASAAQVMAHLHDKSGGNAYTWEVAFLWIASAEDAPAVVEYVDDILNKEGHPLGLNSPSPSASPVQVSSDEVLPHTGRLKAAEPRSFAADKYGMMPFAAAEVLSWRLVSELIRRHPSELWAVRTFPVDGAYDCLTVGRLSTPRSAPQIHLNRHGTHMLVNRFDADASGPGEVLPWPNAFDETEENDSRDWLMWLESVAGLTNPQSGGLPASTPSSLAIRWISTFLALQLGSRERWTAWTCAPGAGRGSSTFATIPAVHHWVERSPVPDSAALVWGLGTARRGESTWADPYLEPEFALTATGDLWSRSGVHHQLPSLHRPGGSITDLVHRTAGDALP